MDGEAMVQYLLSQGVQPQNILIHGWSLGGGVGAHVAALHQEKGKEIHICNDRSFESMVNEVKELARELRKYINTSTLLGKLVSAALALAPITIPLIHMIGWDFKSTQCYQKINGHKFIIYHPNDEIIVYSASLHKNWRI
ncbi:MAG: hypothetical protein HWD61_02335 [Parachlamydiaceae bacterium]|nr:MAG: hypothetical protein HWD61_02335 [Parachlamydiaceae bacterium]